MTSSHHLAVTPQCRSVALPNLVEVPTQAMAIPAIVYARTARLEPPQQRTRPKRVSSTALIAAAYWAGLHACAIQLVLHLDLGVFAPPCPLPVSLAVLCLPTLVSAWRLAPSLALFVVMPLVAVYSGSRHLRSQGRPSLAPHLMVAFFLIFIIASVALVWHVHAAPSAAGLAPPLGPFPLDDR